MPRKTASQRIDDAKRLHGLADAKTDAWLVRIAQSKWSPLIVAAALWAAFGLGWWLG